jgi:hypothetical protein
MTEKKTPYSKAYKKKVLPASEASVGNYIKKEEKKLEKKFGKKKVRKIEHYIVFLIYLAVFLVAGYFLLLTTNPDALPDSFYSYEISENSISITNPLRSLYLEDSSVFSDVVEINNLSGRFIISEKPFNFIFNPKRKLEEDSTAQIQLTFINPGTEIYLNDKLIIPDLDGFEKAADFEDREVWVRDELAKPFYANGDDSESFVYNNFPVTDFYNFGEVQGGTPVIADYEERTTIIPTQFRGDLKLAVYVEGDLEIDFTKQDLNSYVGKDEYTVKIEDLQGNVYYDNLYGDDGDKKDTNEGEFEQKFTLTGEDLPRNIYYITFTKDENNPAADSTIKNIRINSNKVLIVGNSLPWGEFKFYTEITVPETIGFKYWWGGKEQEIEVTGSDEFTIDLDESWINKKYEEELFYGEYTFNIEIGMLWVYSDIIAPSASRWFDLPVTGNSKLINQDIIIIDKNSLEIIGDEVMYTGVISVEEGSKIKLQVLDKLETYFKEIKLVL